MKSLSTFWSAATVYLTCLLLLAACSNEGRWGEVRATIADEHPSVSHISVDSLSNWLNDPTLSEPILLDVRTEEEHQVSHIYGAYRVDPNAETFPFLENVSYSAPIVTYSSVGIRSAAVAERLTEQGFTRVYNLEGSLFQWANNGHPVARGDEEVSGVHPGTERWRRLLNQELQAYESE